MTGLGEVAVVSPIRTVVEYERWLWQQTGLAVLRSEALERMRVNVGLLAENEALRRRVQRLEEGPG